METFPWEVGDPPDGSGGVAEELALALLIQASYISFWSTADVAVAGRSVSLQILSIWSGGGDVGVLSLQGPAGTCRWIGGGHGTWEIEPDMEGVVGSQALDLGLTVITEYSSYSKLWRMLYFVNDAPFCIHIHGYALHVEKLLGCAMPPLQEADVGRTWTP